jgi:hypothetical protein
MHRQKLFETRSQRDPISNPFENIQKQVVYAPCLNCRRHPKYPELAPITRHEEGICAICGGF